MRTLTVLHLSDLHWSDSKANDQKIIIKALLDDIKTLMADGICPDLIIFTGDLVQSGDNSDSFQGAISNFLSPLKKEIQRAPLIVVPGNHDIAREIVRADDGFVEKGLQTSLNSVEKLNNFIDTIHASKKSTLTALERLDNYERNIPSHINLTPDITNYLLKTYQIKFKDIIVGVAAFNTAWRSTGEPDNADRHRLLLGELNIDRAIDSINDCDIRIAAFHHPLNWLRDFDELSVSSRLYSEFDLLMCGHTHISHPEYRITPQGRSILSQAGCLYESREYFNGYQVIRIDLETQEVDFYIRTFFNKRRCFDKAVNIAPNGKVSLPFSQRANSAFPGVETFLRVARPAIRVSASNHVNIVDAVHDLRLDPKQAFICPPLTLNRNRQLPQGGEPPPEESLLPEELLRSTDKFIIVGPRESGKSSLAHYLCVLTAEGIVDRPRIPVLVDFRGLKLNTYGVGKAIASYFGAVKQGLDVESGLKNGDFIFIVDNFSILKRETRRDFEDFLNKYPLIRWVLFSDHTPPHVEQDEHSSPLSSFRIAHIQTLPRKSIRELSRRWCDQMGADNQKTFSVVMEQLNKSNLPRTGYIVTLLLWALYQERHFERINEAVLLTNVIDHLLGKADFQQLQRDFDPTSKEITLQYIATVTRLTNGIVEKNEILRSLIDFFNKKGLKYDADKVLQKLSECGILTDQDGEVSFKYRCFEEYFFANFLRANSKELALILTDRNYVGYGREIELLSGLRRQNGEILEALATEITKNAPQSITETDVDGFDDIANAQSKHSITRKRLIDIRKKKLTSEQIDDLMDAADKEIAKHRIEMVGNGQEPPSPANHSGQENGANAASQDSRMPPYEFIETVDLLGRVLRNSEFNDASEKIAAAKLHVRSSVQMILIYIEILSKIVEKFGAEKAEAQKFDEEDISGIKHLIIQIFVQLMSLQISDQIGTEKLFTTFEHIITDENSSDSERFIISLILFDLWHPDWLKYWSKIIEKSKSKQFLLYIMVDRLWHHVHTKPMSDAERKIVEQAVEKIERALGAPAAAKSAIVRSIQKTAKRVSDEIAETEK